MATPLSCCKGILVGVVFLMSIVLQSIASDPALNYQNLYLEGLVSYNQEDWPTAVEKFQKSLKDYQSVKKSRETCYDQCQPQRDSGFLEVPDDYIKDEQIALFHRILNLYSCQKKCMRRLVGDRYGNGVSYKIIEQSMTSGNIYNYLQFSLFKVNFTLPIQYSKCVN